MSSVMISAYNIIQMTCDLYTGAFGVDFSSLEEDKVAEGVAKVSHHLLEHGVTAYCPTVVTSSPDYYKRTLPQIRPMLGGRKGAAVLGKYKLHIDTSRRSVLVFHHVDMPLLHQV